MRTIRAELRKLVHPVVGITLLVMFGFIWTDARTTEDFARLQTPIAVKSVAANFSSTPTCSPQTIDPTQACKERLLDQALNSHFGDNAIALGRVSNSLRTWPGAVRFVTNQMVAGLGWLLITILVAVHVAGEWSGRTIGTTLLATGNLRRFYMAKVASLTAALLVWTLAAGTLLYFLRGLGAAPTGVPTPLTQSGDPREWHVTVLPADVSWSSLTSTLGFLMIASVVWLVGSMLGTGAAMVLRRPWLTVVAGMTTLSLFLTLAVWGHRSQWTPLPTLAAMFRLENTPFGVRDVRLWHVPGAPTFIQEARRSLILHPADVGLWIAVALAASGVCLAVFRSRPVAG